MLEEIWTYAISLGWLQWLALGFNLIYVVLAARESIWCWPAGLIGVILLFFIYIDARLYSDATLQVFYAMMSVYGWWSWRHRNSSQELVITTLRWRAHLWILCAGFAGTWLFGLFWKQFGAALPFADAFTTSFSILATFLVARKILENWWYWVIIDAVAVIVYWIRDIPLIALLFLIYVVLAIYGWRVWSHKYRMAKAI